MTGNFLVSLLDNSGLKFMFGINEAGVPDPLQPQLGVKKSSLSKYFVMKENYGLLFLLTRTS
jgi:hypothetical protein